MDADRRTAIAGLFDRVAETYDQLGVDFFSTFGRQLVADAALVAGERVLDIGCGRGAVLFPAAAEVGPSGSATGIDLAPGMVERTGNEATARGLTHVRVEVMDAQAPTLPAASFDAVLSSLVVFFLPDPHLGLSAWRELLKPGGRLGLTTFAGDDPRWAWIPDLFKPYVPAEVLALRSRDPDGPFASTQNVDRLLTSAGFLAPTSVIREHVITFRDPEQWITWSWSQGQRLSWEFVPEHLRAEVRAKAIDLMRTFQAADGSVELIQPIRYTLATI